MSLFPMFVKLAGRRCLVVGAGTVAESKIESLLQADAEVRVVAPLVGKRTKEWAQSGRISLEEREFLSRDLDGVMLVVAATSSPGLNARVFQETRSRNVLCNVVDDPAHCDFFYPAVVRRGKLQVAISTEGQSPALAQKLRKELEVQFGPEYEGWVEKLGEARRQLFASDLEAEERRAKLHELASSGPPWQGTEEGIHAR